MMNRDRTGRTTFSSSTGTAMFGLEERWVRTALYPISALLAIFTPLGWLLGLLVLIFEKNRNVRQHAAQATIIFGVLSIVNWLVAFIGSLLSHIWVVGLFIGGAFGLLNWIIIVIIILLAVVMAIGTWFRPGYRLPFVGSLVDNLVARWV